MIVGIYAVLWPAWTENAIMSGGKARARDKPVCNKGPMNSQQRCNHSWALVNQQPTTQDVGVSCFWSVLISARQRHRLEQSLVGLSNHAYPKRPPMEWRRAGK